MSNSQTSSTPRDVPVSLALIGLGLVVGGYFYSQSPTTFVSWGHLLDNTFESHSQFLLAVFLGVCVNGVWGYSLLARSFGLQKQGSRLQALAGKSSAHPPLRWKSIAVSLGIAVVCEVLLQWLKLPREPALLGLSSASAHIFLRGVQINFSMNVFVISLILSRLPIWKSALRWLPNRLPKFPEIKNGIVLGSVNEESPGEEPSWAVLNRIALNGNILATGGIGTGKSSGFILPVFEQILTNFTPRPSILAIDPKGTFIPEALKLAKKHGLSKHVFHLKLGGDVTFNPIDSPNPLKEAHFLNTAHMIRAAAVNYMGKSFDSPFWELSAFNLIKNCVVLCGAKYCDDSFGLTQLYSEMIAAASDSSAVVSDLERRSKAERFDAEERFNVLAAAQYFKEFEQLDSKVKTGILATSTAFLNQFQEYQAHAVFCPSREKAVIKSMDDVVDQGKILLVDIASPALAKSMGTFIKLHYEQSVLNRLKNNGRKRDRTAFLIIDEFQDVVSTGGGAAIGDDRFIAQSREANAVMIAATQSQSSLKNAIGKEDAARELLNNFRTLIAGQSTDVATTKYFREIAGQVDRSRISRSISENAHNPNRNLMLGGFETAHANLSESINTTEQKEHLVTGKDFAALSTFEFFGLIYDGIKTKFQRLYLKPFFLKNKAVVHSKLLKKMAALCLAVALFGTSWQSSYAFPQVCSVMKSNESRSCMDFKVGVCICGYPPHPCANFSYYVPQTFVEVFPHPKDSYFKDLPGAAVQLSTLGSKVVPFGAEGDEDTQSFEAHVLGVPLSSTVFSVLPCGNKQFENLCFGGMSEHLDSLWSTGSADKLQPEKLAWSLSPKACLLKGAITSFMGESESSWGGTGLACSIPMSWMPIFPPSMHSSCTGWGTFYPRNGTYHGPSQTTGALMIASRMRSLGSEVFHATPSASDEFWQMISPQTSSCFREGQNVGILETLKNVRELKRLTTGKLTGYLFTVWSKVSCCKELALVPAAYLAIEAMHLACQPLGAL